MRIRQFVPGLALLVACGGAPAAGPAAVASVQLNNTDLTLASGVTSHLSATALDANGASISGKTATWTTTDGQFATVSSSGDVQGVKIGSAVVKATIDGKEASATIHVNVGAPTAIAITAGQGQSAEVGAAVAVLLKARVRDFGDNPVPNAQVRWDVGLGGGKTAAPITVTTDASGLATAPAWNLGVIPGPNSLIASIGALNTPVTATATYTRVSIDRVDEVAGSQAHIIYAVPADLADRSLDVNGRLATSISVFQRFAITKTNGRRVKFDTFNGGVPDITFIRLTQTDAQIKAAATPQQGIEAALIGLGFLKPGKVYLVYYDGTSLNACAQADLAPGAPGGVSAAYLRGSFNAGAGQCLDLSGMAETINDAPRYWEFVGLHELMHTMSLVGAAAPNHVAAIPGHVPEPTDLMFAGAAPWAPAEFDIGNNDYSGAALPGALPNFLTSPFPETVPVSILAFARQLAAVENRTWRMPAWVRMDQMEGIVPRR